MKIVGITGGIGSGKTTICNILKIFNIPVYHADIKAKELSDRHPDLVHGFKELFGAEIYTNQVLNRAEVARRVFKNQEMLNLLNSIVHPIVEEDFNEWKKGFSDCTFVVKEAAILFENGGYTKMDFNVLVVSPEKIRIRRVMKRDNVSGEQVSERIQNQWNDEKKIPLADYIINCDEEKLVIPQVIKLLKKLNNKWV